MASAESMLFGKERGPVSLWGMRCLSMLIEAVCLYDELLVYDVHPFRMPYDFFTFVYLTKQPWIRAVDFYGSIEEHGDDFDESFEERAKVRESFKGAHDDLPTGRMFGGEFLDFPASFWKSNAISLRKFPRSSDS